MLMCETCGYSWPNYDGDFNHCHFEGPEGWAPCEYDEYNDSFEDDYHDDIIEEPEDFELFEV